MKNFAYFEKEIHVFFNLIQIILKIIFFYFASIFNNIFIAFFLKKLKRNVILSLPHKCNLLVIKNYKNKSKIFR